ncbi:hypothetical protein PIROE2DRAFT_19408 [Piromyces sp. E2]|nr:hypothetical protein PIROE2DRAFT_19408 [Piromyces sp. E2]|eukprot:OUM56131.1 hypothetical protein PIROE2DRAFT_19408 [Piromyces sp. E2]
MEISTVIIVHYKLIESDIEDYLSTSTNNIEHYDAKSDLERIRDCYKDCNYLVLYPLIFSCVVICLLIYNSNSLLDYSRNQNTIFVISVSQKFNILCNN